MGPRMGIFDEAELKSQPRRSREAETARFKADFD